MNLFVQDKTLDVSPIQTLLRQGENRADAFIITMERYYAGLDRAALTWRMRGFTEKETLAESTLPKITDGNEVLLNWEVTSPFTQADGVIGLELRGTADSGAVVCIIGAAPLRVWPDVAKGYAPPPGVWETVLDEMHEAVDESRGYAEKSKQSAAESASSAAQSEDSATRAEAAREEAEALRDQTEGIRDSAVSELNVIKSQVEELREGAQSSADDALGSAGEARKSEASAQGHSDAAQRYAGIAQDAARGVAESAAAALESENAARGEAERAGREADRAEREADRSEEAANRAQDIANLYFKNPHTDQMEPLQSILTENFGFLFNLMRRLHGMGLTWKQINEKGLAWAQINARRLTWEEISLLKNLAAKTMGAQHN